MAIVVLTETELRQCVCIDQQGIQVVSEGFSALARGEAVMPPILSLDISEQNGEVDIKTAYIKRFDSFAIKISSGFFDNPKLGLPSLSGMMTLLSAKTGQLTGTGVQDTAITLHAYRKATQRGFGTIIEA